MELNTAAAMANDLMREHALLKIVEGWRFGGFDRATKRAGITRYREKIWTLSGPLTRLNGDEFVRQTSLHEIAHILAGPKAGHGYAWLATARKLGYTGGRTVPGGTIIQPDTPLWWGICGNNPDHRIGYQRRPADKTILYSVCGKCRGRFRWLNTRTGEVRYRNTLGKLVVMPGVS